MQPTHEENHERVQTELLDSRAVAAMLGCGPRHVYRLSDTGRMPRPVKLGGLVRWRRAELLAWIEGGCRSLNPSYPDVPRWTAPAPITRTQ